MDKPDTNPEDYLVDRLIDLYKCIIDSDKPIPVRMQPQMIAVLTEAGDYSALGSMAERSDTSEEADKQLGAILEPEVIRGWALRHGRQSSEITSRLAGETRIGNLLPIARTRGMSPEVYTAIGRTESLKLAEALLNNPDVPAEAKLCRVEAITACLDKQRGWRQQHSITAAIGEHPGLAEALLRRTRSALVALAALEVVPRPQAETVEILVSRLDDMVEAEDIAVNTVIKLLELTALLDLDAKQLRHLRAIVKKCVTEHDDTTSYWGPDFKHAKFLVSKEGRRALEESRGLETADPDTVVRVLKSTTGKANAEHPLEQVALASASKNPRVAPKILKARFEDIPADHAVAMLERWLADGQVDDVLDVAGEEYSTPWWLDRMSDPTALLLRSIEKARLDSDLIPDWVITHPLIAGTATRAIELLPWYCLAEADKAQIYFTKAQSYFADDEEDVTLPRTESTLMTEVLQIIAARLGDDQTKWDTFQGLADEFEGTLSELLDAATTL